MLEIDVIIREEKEKPNFNLRIIQILERLKELNKDASDHMSQFGKSWKQKYHQMWRQKFWKEAKELLREYNHIEHEGSFCHMCSEPLRVKFTLHHEEDFYKTINMFNPNVVMLIHNKCHQRYHKK